MIDLRKTVIPKSDQLNADDLIGQTRTIKVTKVSLLTEADQPIAIGFEGDNGKPYKPCKSMRRVMVNIWGPDGNAYVGRSMMLYRDDKVMFGGAAVGGIRISHMSHIDSSVTMALTVTRANRKPFTVQPLATPRTPNVAPNGVQIDATLRAQGDDAAAHGMDALRAFWTSLSKSDKIKAGNGVQLAAWKAIAEAADVPDVDFDNPSPSPHTDRREAAAADASPAERRAGSSTSDLEGDPAPVPHEPAGAPVPAEAVLRPPLESAAPASNPPAGAAPTDPEANCRARITEIRAEGQARAEAGTAALAAYLEERRQAGEADLISSVTKAALRDVAKAVDAAKGKK